MNAKTDEVMEITDQIYDTIMGNVGMSEYHIKFDPEKVSQAEVNRLTGRIVFKIGDNVYEVIVNQINDNYFDENF